MGNILRIKVLSKLFYNAFIKLYNNNYIKSKEHHKNIYTEKYADSHNY